MFGSSRISNSSKLSCMLSLPASMKRIPSRTAEKKWRHHFSHYKPMRIFSDVQGQLTQQSVVQSGQNSILSELSCMSSLHASMKRIRRKTAEKKWRHPFFPSQPYLLPWKPVVGSGQISNSSNHFMYVIITCKYEKDLIKNS